ncbi:MAG: ribonuclease III domain-containing protein [Clostridia bacterium]
MLKYIDMNFCEILLPNEAKQLNPLALAFVGDAVHSLFVREILVHKQDSKAGVLHTLTSSEVKCTHQCLMLDKIIDSFTEEEIDIYKRARNCHNNNVAKNATLVEYKKATGFEAVIGYLYLTGQRERLTVFLGVK